MHCVYIGLLDVRWRLPGPTGRRFGYSMFMRQSSERVRLRNGRLLVRFVRIGQALRGLLLPRVELLG
jgi:hypothetical protein